MSLPSAAFPSSGRSRYPCSTRARNFRLDFLVGKLVVVEVKAVEALSPVHSAQVLTYLRLAGCKLGLLLNFNEWRLADGIKRLVLNLAAGK
jgi:GxxExxY protein